MTNQIQTRIVMFYYTGTKGKLVTTEYSGRVEDWTSKDLADRVATRRSQERGGYRHMAVEVSPQHDEAALKQLALDWGSDFRAATRSGDWSDFCVAWAGH